MMSRRRLLALFNVVAFTFGLALSAAAQDTRIAAGDRAKPGYRAQHALIIGINYTDRNDLFKLSPLDNAESDAAALAAVLKKHFGYDEDKVSVLTGKDATQQAIMDAFAKLLKVKPDDSVLIFFAGHGQRIPVEGEKDLLGVLFPYDVKFARNEENDTTVLEPLSCLLMDDLFGKLKKFCPARHKLLILDACHSGTLFDVARSRAASTTFDPHLFEKPVFQALAATRADSTAADGSVTSDGTARQSPFMTALVKGLSSDLKEPVIAANELFTYVERSVLESTRKKQHPLGGVLDGDGEFYFFRKSIALDSASPAAAALFVQTMPGLNGKWWFDETPWLAPSLRKAISLAPASPELASLSELAPLAPLPRAGDAPAAESLTVTAAYGRLRDSVKNHLATLNFDQQRAVRALLNLGDTKGDAVDPESLLEVGDALEDPHLKAVLYHRLNRPEADDLYQAAIRGYEASLMQAGKGPDVRGLRRLCCADYGRFKFDTGKYAEAIDLLQLARGEAPSDEAPAVFFIDVLCTEAQCHSRLARWEDLRNCLELALDIAARHLPPQHPLIAYAHDRFAWGLMDQWKIADAVKHFDQALAIRRRQPDAFFLNRINLRHNEHGLAMSLRFMGRLADARTAYRKVSDEVREEFESFDGTGRDLLAERYVNTLERLADCYLLCTAPDCEVAAEALLSASDRCGELPPRLRGRVAARLQAKLAIAYALFNQADVARETIQAASREELTPDQKAEVELYTRVAEALADLSEGKDSGLTLLRTLLAEQSRPKARERLKREELELMLFAGQRLIAHELQTENIALADLGRDSEAVLNLVPESFINVDVLPYLRPYLDAAIRAKLKLNRPLELPRTLRYMALAKTGVHDFRPAPDSHLVFFYLLDGSDGFVVYVPKKGMAGNMPRIFTIENGGMRARDLKLPPELAGLLQQVKDPVQIHWKDLGQATPLSNESFPVSELASGRLID